MTKTAFFRTILLGLLIATGAAMSAQTATTAANTTTATTTANTTTATTAAAPHDADSQLETRNHLNELLMRGADELPTVLALEPALLNNDAFLAMHPELARFVAAHPEVRQEPSYYIEDFSGRARRQPSGNNIIEPIMAFCAFATFVLALAWLIRTLIEQKRWNRLAQTQSEVHNKILDRVGAGNELIEYIRTPAGSRFLESAPIPLHAQHAQPTPLGRGLLSIQIGLILSAGAIGMLLVSGRFANEGGSGLWALGIIGLCLGGGFVISAIVSLFIARRLGLWEPPSLERAAEADQ